MTSEQFKKSAWLYKGSGIRKGYLIMKIQNHRLVHLTFYILNNDKLLFSKLIYDYVIKKLKFLVFLKKFQLLHIDVYQAKKFPFLKNKRSL